ncbi:50S ribosomal protein L15 [Candidatus Curtissbacteria bacterium RIFCSPHIGHO2_02_39_8]|nr:MAG: 50S ribosomal protein L15 [Candidatus Curtissbacteria bacterium RIFCSPHIGHO2_02_39_8]
MRLDTLPKITTKSAKRVGRGHGSGKGKTSGRGTKGQKARGKLPITHPHFEGGSRPLIKRLPIRRGKGNPKISKKPLVVNIEALNILPKSVAQINLETLIKLGIVEEDDAKIYGVKLLGDGQVDRPFTVYLPISKNATSKIEKSGGKIILVNKIERKAENK